MTDTVFHTKYRPRTLDQLIGHEQVKTRLMGMVRDKQVPGALLIVGPSSVGKTTIARALATEINGQPIEVQAVSDYKEMDMGSARSIDDVRELIRLSKLRPRANKRIFVLDEAQALLSNRVAATALLKAIEDAGTTDTVWILCSMEPSKFKNDVGRAIANRCTQLVLAPHTDRDLYTQGLRIIKGEQIKGMNKELLNQIVKVSNNEMRQLANNLQAVRDFVAGGGRPTVEALTEVIAGNQEQDDQQVINVVRGLANGEYAAIVKALLDVQEPFQFVNKLMWAAQFLLYKEVVGKHPKVWWTPVNRELAAICKGQRLGNLAAFNEMMVNLKLEVQNFSTGEIELMAARFLPLVKQWHAK